MIFRLSLKLNTRIKGSALASLPMDENPFADWSAGLFLARRLQFILVTNTKTLYSTVLPGKGITDEKILIERVSNGIREFLEADGYRGVYERSIAPLTGSVRFARTLNRSITRSMNDMVKHAVIWLEEGDLSPIEIGSKLKEIPMTGLKYDGTTHGYPRDVFADMVACSGN